MPVLPELRRRDGRRRRARPRRRAVTDGFVILGPVPEGVRIERDDDGSFQVVGRQAERAVALSDLTNLEALDYAHRRLSSSGVDKALARAGASEGDTVVIGDFSSTSTRTDCGPGLAQRRATARDRRR